MFLEVARAFLNVIAPKYVLEKFSGRQSFPFNAPLKTFTTEFGFNALKAFEDNDADYLLKPIRK